MPLSLSEVTCCERASDLFDVLEKIKAFGISKTPIHTESFLSKCNKEGIIVEYYGQLQVVYYTNRKKKPFFHKNYFSQIPDLEEAKKHYADRLPSFLSLTWHERERIENGQDFFNFKL